MGVLLRSSSILVPHEFRTLKMLINMKASLRNNIEVIPCQTDEANFYRLSPHSVSVNPRQIEFEFEDINQQGSTQRQWVTLQRVTMMSKFKYGHMHEFE